MGVGSSGSARCGPKIGLSDALRTPVTLHIYDLGRSSTVQVVNGVLRALGAGGAFHCGVEVHRREWSYEASGIFCCKPKQCEEHNFHESLLMGETSLSESGVLTVVERLEAQLWTGQYYDTLKHNCCHFCDKLCKGLGVGRIPDSVQDLARKAGAVCDVMDSLRNGVIASGLGDPLVCCCSEAVAAASAKAAGQNRAGSRHASEQQVIVQSQSPFVDTALHERDAWKDDDASWRQLVRLESVLDNAGLRRKSSGGQ